MSESLSTSLAEFLLPHFEAHLRERAYGQRRGYRMEWFTYGQVRDLCFRFVRELEARQIRKGDRVMLWGENCAEWVAAFWGCVIAGVVVVPMDDGAAADFAGRVLLQVGARLVVCSRGHMPEIAKTSPFLILEELAVTLSSLSDDAVPVSYVGRHDFLQIVFTSGTTAEPKGVVITHGNVLTNVAPLAQQIRGYLKYERLVHPVRFLNLLPLSHVFGQFLGMFLPPLMGATVIFQDEFKPAEIVSTARREKVSVVVSVPRLLQSLRQKLERDFEDRGELEMFRRRFSAAQRKHFFWRWWIFRDIHRQFGWKFWAFISGGASLDSEAEEFWGRLGYAVIQGYGLTETTSLISVNHPFRLGKGSIGKVLAGREIKLAADGEILVRGGGVAAGYWNGTDRQSVASEDGWYRTGDVGELDGEGNLYFKGRKKEVIVTSAGMNIYPEDLEAALRRQPEVKDAVVISLPRDGNAEPCGAIILRNRDADPELIVKRANKSLAEYQRMNAWVLWREEDFPRTSTQKPLRGLIQQAVQAQLAHTSVNPMPSGPLAELIARITKRSPSQLAPSAKLESDLNLSSLDRVELLSALEDRYQIDLSETRFAAVNTVGELERMLQGKLPPRTPYHYPRWVQRWPVTWVRLAVHYLLLRPAVFLLGWPRVEGRQNLRGVAGPVLVICNYISAVEPGFVLTALPARLRHKLAIATGGEALEILRTPPATRGFVGSAYDGVKWALGVSLLNLFPLPREAGFRESFAYAGESVDRGYSVLVFPEGRHTTDGKLLQFRAGIGLLANNLQIPIIPIRIDGLFEVKQTGKKFAHPGQLKVKIGTPVQFAPGSDPEWIAHELQGKVEQL